MQALLYARGRTAPLRRWHLSWGMKNAAWVPWVCSLPPRAPTEGPAAQGGVSWWGETVSARSGLQGRWGAAVYISCLSGCWPLCWFQPPEWGRDSSWEKSIEGQITDEYKINPTWGHYIWDKFQWFWFPIQLHFFDLAFYFKKKRHPCLDCMLNDLWTLFFSVHSTCRSTNPQNPFRVD